MISRQEFIDCYRRLTAGEEKRTTGEIINMMCYELFDSPGAVAMNASKQSYGGRLKIDLKPNILPIPEQIAEIAHERKSFGGHFNAQGDIEYFMTALSYRDKLAVIDVFQQNVNLQFLKANGFIE